MSTKIALVALVALALPLAACEAENSTAADVSRAASELVQIQGTSSVSLLAGQTIAAGTVSTSIEGENVKITYATTGGWLLHETHLWAGLTLAAMPQTNSGNPKVGNFPYNSGALGGVTSYSVLVPLSTFGLTSSMTQCAPVTAYIVSHAVVKKQLADGTFQSETAYGEGTRLVQKGNWATWFSVVLTCTDDQPPVAGTCETAFAFDENVSTCFIGSGLLDTNRWGWFNGPVGPGSYLFDIYAGAGKCDIGKGTYVGDLKVEYDGAAATVSYTMLPGFKLDETHLYVGNEPLPRLNGEYTVAPGQYGNIHDLANVSADSFTVSGLSGSIHVVAHATVCSSSWPQ